MPNRYTYTNLYYIYLITKFQD